MPHAGRLCIALFPGEIPSMDDLLRDFLDESNDSLLQLDLDIVALEEFPDDRPRINRIFRTIHTIKGTCGFLELDRLERVAHATESVLDRMRSQELDVSKEIITDILSGIDTIKSIFDHLETTGKEPVGNDVLLLDRLDSWINGKRQSEQNAAPSPGDYGDGEVEQTYRETTTKSVGDATLRVQVEVLDSLMTTVGELVLDRNRLLQIASRRDDIVLTSTLQHLSRVTSELQESVMRTRMEPISVAWTKLPRLVRDLAQSSGKQLRLLTSGADTELDRQILQAIVDPLTHMVRNSADHGIESPEQRRQANKSVQGTIRLDASHEGGHVVIQISDDGAGISVERVRQKAVGSGLLTAAAADTLSDSQVLRLIFEPGFSTATHVTNVSGRGVGMDVVRTNIENIGGQIDIQSVEGSGTRIRIKIPLTLAIVPALTVSSGSAKFVIPQMNIVEIIRTSVDDRGNKVEILNDSPVYRHRGKVFPLVFLSEVLRSDKEKMKVEEITSIVVVRAEGQIFGLVVDALRDSQEIVVKPLSKYFHGLDIYSGATIMGDGSVALILDIPGIARSAAAIDHGKKDSSGGASDADPHTGKSEVSGKLLIVKVGESDRVAMELDDVECLSMFKKEEIKHLNGREVAQFRDQAIPLISLSEWLDKESSHRCNTERDGVSVVIHTRDTRTIGIVVDRVHDIVADYGVIQSENGHSRTLGTVLIDGQATDIVDLDRLVENCASLSVDVASLEAVA